MSGEVVFAPVFADKQTGEIWDLDALAKGIGEYAARQKGKLRGKIVREIRRFKPDVAITWDPYRRGHNHFLAGLPD